MRVWINNNELSLVVQGVVFQEELSEALDTVTIKSLDYVQDEPFEPLSKIKILLDDGTYKHYLVQNDLVERHSKIVPCYIHNTIGIEQTYYLSKIIMPSQAFTLKKISYKDDDGTIKERPTTMLDYLQFALMNAEPLINTIKPRFSLGEATSKLFEEASSEDFFFDKPSLKDVLDAMMSVRNCRCRVDDIDFEHIVISHYDLNKQGEKVEFNNVVSDNKQSDATYVSNTVETNFTNAVDRNVRAYHGWDILKPVNGEIVNSESYTFANLLPIESIESVKLRRKFQIIDPDNEGGNVYVQGIPLVGAGTVIVDASKYFIDEEIYNLLANDQQQSYIPYTRGTSQFGSLNYKKIFFTYNKLEKVFEKCAENAWVSENVNFEYNESYNGSKSWSDDSPAWKDLTCEIQYPGTERDIEYLIEYTPYVDSKASLTKVNSPGISTSQIANPEDKNISIERYGQSFRNKVNQLGNNSYEVDTVCYDILELKNLGDYTKNNYVISSKEYAVYDKFIKVHYTLTKNFNNSILKVSIDREKRLYNIPLESITSHLLIKEYIGLSAVNANNKNNFFCNSIIESYLKSFSDVTHENIFKKIAFRTATMDSYFLIDATEFAFGNSNCWHWQMMDNYSVELGVAKRILGGKAIAYNPYVNTDNGTIARVARPGSYIAMSYITLAPVKEQVNTEVKTGLGEYACSDAESLFIYCYKDPYIRLTGTVQAEFVSLDEKIIIGPAIAKYNNFNYKMTDMGHLLEMWVSKEKYTVRDKVAKGDFNSLQVEELNENCIKFFIPAKDIYSSWAISTEEGELLFAVNDMNIDTIYFNVSKKI